MNRAVFDTYKVTDATMLFEFCSGKLSHISSRPFFRDVGGAAYDFSPQSQRTLSLYELMEL
jgi:hypothetical protein